MGSGSTARQEKQEGEGVLASGSADNRIILWGPASGSQLAPGACRPLRHRQVGGVVAGRREESSRQRWEREGCNRDKDEVARQTATEE